MALFEQDITRTLQKINEQLARHEAALQTLMKAQHMTPSSAPSPTPRRGRPVNHEDIEQQIGSRWLGWVGFLAFLTGVAFFLRYAFEQGWITYFMRMAIGYLGGLLMLGGGELLRRRYQSYGNLIQGVGVGVLYLSTYAAFHLYHLINIPVAFIIIGLIAIGTIAMAVVTKSSTLLNVSLVGAYLTPYLLPTAQDHRTLLFPFLTLLLIASFVIAKMVSNIKVPLWSLIGTFFLVSNWFITFYQGSLHWYLTGWLAVFAVLVLAGRMLALPLLISEKNPLSQLWDFLPVIILVFSLHTSFLILPNATVGITTLGLLALGYAFIGGIGVIVARLLTNQVTNIERALLIGSLYSLFVSIMYFVPNNRIILETIVATISAFLIFGLALVLPRPELRIMSLLTLAFAFVLATDVRYPSPQEFKLFVTPAFGMRFFVLAVGAVIAYLYRRDWTHLDPSERSQLFPVFLILLNLGFLWLVSREIASWYDPSRHGLSTLSYNPVAEKIRDTKNIITSLFWGLYGAVALVVGFALKSRHARLGALALLAATIVKVFFYDFWDFGTLYRMIVSLLLGILLLAGAFLYHRYQDRVTQFIKSET